MQPEEDHSFEVGREYVVRAAVGSDLVRDPCERFGSQVLRWLGSAEGASYVGAEGAGLPAVTAAPQEYYDYWEGQDVDTCFFGADGGTAMIPAPSGAKFEAASTAFNPILNEVFAGRTPVGEGLQAAQDAGNAALR